MLSASVRERMLRTLRVGEDGFGYGYGLNVGAFRGMRYCGHSGEIQGFTSTLACFPDQGVQIACMTNRQDLGAWTCRDWVLDTLFGTPATSHLPEPPPHPKCVGLEELLGLYLNPTSACFLELVNPGHGPAVSLNGGALHPLSGTGPWQTAHGMTIIRHDGEARSSLVVQMDHVDSVASEYFPFTQDNKSRELSEYEGTYECRALAAAFDVEATSEGIRLTNVNPQHPAMNLLYKPTILDFFWSRDPHPELSQLQFLRDADGCTAFVYRDHDGDHRESFHFVRKVSQ